MCFKGFSVLQYYVDFFPIQEIWISNSNVNTDFGKGAFKYYVIMFLTFLGPPTHLFDDLQYCKSSKIAKFWPHPPTSLMT